MSTSPESPPVPTSAPGPVADSPDEAPARPDEGSTPAGSRSGPYGPVLGSPAGPTASVSPAGPSAGGPNAAGPNAWQPTAPSAPPLTAGPYPPAPGWYPYPPEPTPRMRRSANDKMLAGVCGGIAEHTDIDPVYIRLAFLISLLWGGIGFFVYIVAAVLIPKPLPAAP